MSDADKKKVLQKLADSYADEYGLDRVTITFKDLDDSEGDAMGYWNEGFFFGLGRELVLDSSDLGDASIMIDTIAHEMRHAGQHEMIRGYEGPWWQWGRPEWNNPDGVTAEQVEAWKKNFDNYKTPEKDGWAAYLGQPVEVDARSAGTRGSQAMTLDELNRLKNS